MFEAVRSRLVGAWRDLRARGLPSLFLFELVVVTLGVLLAQAIADYAGDRAAERRMKGSLARLNDASALNMMAAEAWMVTTRCMRARVEDIMRRAGAGEDIPPEWVDRPGILGTYAVPFSDEDGILLRQRDGEEEGLRRDSFELARVSLDKGAEAVTDQWQRLSVIDTRLGPVSPGDRVGARGAGADLLSSFRRIEVSASNVLALGGALGLEPEYMTGRVAENCKEFWEHGAIVHEEAS